MCLAHTAQMCGVFARWQKCYFRRVLIHEAVFIVGGSDSGGHFLLWCLLIRGTPYAFPLFQQRELGLETRLIHNSVFPRQWGKREGAH